MSRLIVKKLLSGGVTTLLLLFLAGVGAGCGSKIDYGSAETPQVEATAGGSSIGKSKCRASEGEAPDYEMRLTLSDFEGYFVMTVNGFPVERLPSMSSMTKQEVTGQLNTALVEKRNEAGVEVMPYLSAVGTNLDVGTVDIQVEVLCEEEVVQGGTIEEAAVDSAYRAWTDRARAKWRDYQSRNVRGALDSIRAWAEQNPMTVSTTFDNEAGPDFSRLFEEAPVIEGTPTDSARLKDYAMHLQSLLREKKGAALYREIRPAAEASARELGESPPPTSKRRARWRKDAENGEGWFDEKPPEFGRSDVGLDRWAEGRVWELYRRPGREPLLGGWNIFIAEVEGELKVVRLE
jgi:hypothetical protein